jgi:hypothetical protein
MFRASLLDAQQQLKQRCMANPNKLNAVAVHIRPNIVCPKAAPMLISLCEVMTLRKMTNMTVPIMVATVVSSVPIKVQIVNGKDHHLE